MVYKLDYAKLKEGQLDSQRRSSLLAQFILESQHEWISLKDAILNADEESIFSSCQFVSELSTYFQFEQVNEFKEQLNQEASDGVFNMELYHKMIKEWSQQICKLRTFNQSNTTSKQYSVVGY